MTRLSRLITRSTLLAITIFAASALVSAQLLSVNPAPGQSDGIIGPQLIAWSAMQKPQPVPQQPQPIPGPDQAQPSSQNPQPKSQPDQAQQPEPETQQTSAQGVNGVISKVGGKYVLETDDSVSYQLDTQANAAQYVGKHVKVTGVRDRKTGIIRVRSIELLS
jgi:hypothetical protein